MSTFPEPHHTDTTTPQTPGAEPVLSGHEAFDEHHDKLGTVTDVLYDDQGAPRWAVINPGLLQRERYVPVDGAFVTEAGQVVMPYSRDTVKAARPASRDHILDPVVERALEEHYALPHR